MKGARFALTGSLGRWVLNGLMATLRFTVEHEERYRQFVDGGEPVILSVWHGRLLPLTWFHRDREITAMISQSEDGEYIARVVQGWGYHTVRGSTSRGASDALRGLVKAARKGHSLAITPDGPRGPRQELQHGVITVAQLTGLPIIPLAGGCGRAWWPGTWDRFCVPKPFSEVTVRYGEPYYVSRDATPEEREAHRVEVEARMNRMIEELDRHGGPDR
ncbi:MAG: lysophospholipid acyltransferase family protein [Longimicrobiales bacterium]